MLRLWAGMDAHQYMTKPREPLDLTGDNRIKELLEQRERLAVIIRRAKLLKEEAEAEIRDKLGEAEEAFTDNWLITVRTVPRREFTVPAGPPHQVLRAMRLEPPSEPEEEFA
jgi:hypothetical protein